MSLQTGGRAAGATSTRSRSASCARRRASSILTMPTVSPLGPTRRTSGTRIRSLIRSSVLMGPPVMGRMVFDLLGGAPEKKASASQSAEASRPRHVKWRQPRMLPGPPYDGPDILVTGPDDLVTQRPVRVGGELRLSDPTGDNHAQGTVVPQDRSRRG